MDPSSQLLELELELELEKGERRKEKGEKRKEKGERREKRLHEMGYSSCKSSEIIRDIPS